MQENNIPDKSNTAKGSKSGKKKHISPQEPKDLLTGSSFIARELVPQYLKLGVLNKRDAVAQYIASGVIDFGRRGKPYMESGETIARALDIPSEAFRDTVSDLKKAGIIGRTGKNGDRLKFRRWFIPALEPFISLKMTAGINGGDRRCERRVTAGMDGGATAGVNGGLLRESGSEKNQGEVNKEEEEETQTPPPVVSQDSFKIRTAEDATEYLKPYDLLMPEGLSEGYYDVIAMVSGCYHRTVDELDVTSAELLLQEFPSDFKRPEILANWIYWRACQLPAKWNKKTHFFTKIEETWEAFRPQAETILKDLKVVDEERRKAELRHQTEQAEAERMRQEAQDALQAVEDERLGQEEQARQLARHKAFVASLPAEESIIASIMAVPDLETFGYNEYLEWLNAMIDAVGLKLVLESSPYYYSYFKAAYRTVGFVPAEMITQTQQFIERVASGVLRGLRDSVAQCELIPRKVTWEMYCEHFGLNERNDRLCGCEIPKGALEYRKPIHNG